MGGGRLENLLKINNWGLGINGGLESRKQGHFDEQLSHLLSYTIRLFNKFNTFPDSLLQTSCIIICSFNFSQAEVNSRRENSIPLMKVWKLINWGLK